ncbi:MAG: diguanylate cyclase [Leptolyngbya sp. BL-A-14]
MTLNRQSSLIYILLVDDNPVNLKVLAESLEGQGWKILMATDGTSAIEQAEYVRPDLILLDVMMAGIDGFETGRRLKASPLTQSIPLIFMTARSNTTDKVEGLELGAVDYITKPFQREEVVARLKLHLKISHLHHKLSDLNQSLQQEIKHRMAVQADLQAANEKLQRLAYFDGLTQIANRRQFDERFIMEWRRMKREQLPLSLILCDIDYFKQYNDTYGHQVGDDCLCSVAAALTMAARRPSDLAARYGGEEFAVLLPNTPLDGAITVVQVIQTHIKNLKRHHQQSKVSHYVTASFGVASCIPTAARTPEQLLAKADQALYQAKLEGRDRFCTGGWDTVEKDPNEAGIDPLQGFVGAQQ